MMETEAGHVVIGAVSPDSHSCMLFTKRGMTSLERSQSWFPFLHAIYTTKIDGVVCPPNISETVAGRLMKLAHRQRIASTTIKLISKKFTVHFTNF